MPKLSLIRITDLTVRTSKAKANRYFIRDSNVRGFMLRVNPNGNKVYYVQLDQNTKRKIGEASVLTLTSARDQAKELLVRHAKGEHIESRRERKPSLGEFLKTSYKPWAQTHNRHGVTEVSRLVSALGGLIKQRMDKLSQIKIERWKQDRAQKVRPSTVNRELASLKAALNRATEWGYISANPAAKVRRLKDVGDKRVRYLSDAERTRLINVLDQRSDHIRYIVLLTMDTGLRRGEIFGLKWSDIRLGLNPTLTVRAASAKSKKERHIPLNNSTASLLKDWRSCSDADLGHVFPSSSGGQLTDIKRSWGSLIKAADIVDFRFHDLRHDFASRLVMRGADLYSVKELLGHGSIEMTQRYAHLSPDTLRSTIAVLETEK